jgi:hypothetical protein
VTSDEVTRDKLKIGNLSGSSPVTSSLVTVFARVRQPGEGCQRAEMFSWMKKLEARVPLCLSGATPRSGRDCEVSMTRQVDGKAREIGFRFLDELPCDALWRVLRGVRGARRAARGLFKGWCGWKRERASSDSPHGVRKAAPIFDNRTGRGT